MNELIPPQAIELEEAVLGALLLERNAFSLVEGIIKPEYFYKDSHQVIYEAICSLHNKDKPVDMLTVVQELGSMGKLDEAGGAYNVTTMTSKVASAAHIEHHCAVIAEKYERRSIISKALALASNAANDTIDMDRIMNDASEIDKASGASVDNKIKPSSDLMDEAIVAMKERIDRKRAGLNIGIETPLYGLNRMIVGFMPTQFIVIGARPMVGKTSFALACAKHQASLGFKPCFMSLEMPGISLADRLICAEAGVDPTDYRSGSLNPLDIDACTKAAKELSKYNIYVSDETTLSVFKLRSTVKRLVSKGLCDILYVDYLQLMDGEGSESRQEEVSTISRGLKKLAMECDIPIVALSQLSRDVERRAGGEGKRPQLADLRSSGAIEQDANIVMFLHKPALYNLHDEEGNPYPKTHIEIIVAKHREGETGDVTASTNKSCSIYYDKHHEPYQEPEQRITQTDIFTNDSENPFGDFQKEFNTGSMGQNIFPD